jgi:hypothetical protein
LALSETLTLSESLLPLSESLLPLPKTLLPLCASLPLSESDPLNLYETLPLTQKLLPLSENLLPLLSLSRNRLPRPKTLSETMPTGKLLLRCSLDVYRTRRDLLGARGAVLPGEKRCELAHLRRQLLRCHLLAPKCLLHCLSRSRRR